MTLRTRLTAAFLAVVLGPVMLGAVAVGVTATTVSRGQERERLRTAESALATAVNALCQRARAAAEALAATTARGVPARTAATTVVRRGLVDAAWVEGADGRLAGRAGALPGGALVGYWGDCASPRDSGAALGATGDGTPLLGAVLELRRSDGTPGGRALTAFAVTAGELRRLAAAAGVGVTIVRGDRTASSTLDGPAARAVSTAPRSRRLDAGTPLRVRVLTPSAGQPFTLVLSTPSRDLGGLYATLALIAVLVAAAAVLVAGYFARTLTRPLADVALAAERVAAGDLGARVPVRAHDEIGRLASTFNRMTREMQGYVAALTASRDQVRGSLALLGETLSSTHDLDRILQVILESVLVATGAEAGVVLLAERDPDRWADVLVGRCGHGLAARGVEPAALRVAVGDGLLGRVAASGEALRGRVLDGDGLMTDGEPTCRTFIAVPFFARPAGALDAPEPSHSGDLDTGDLDTGDRDTGDRDARAEPPDRSPGRLLGVLALYDRLGADDFDDGDLVMLRSFAGQAAVAVENVLRHRETQRASLVDPLTGLWNDRYLGVSLRRELERAIRFGRPLAVLRLDLDEFAALQRAVGYRAAEDVLATVARRLLETVREVDLVFRPGAAEFVLLLPETGAEGAATAAARIGAALRDTPVRVGRGADEVAVACTGSIGVAVHPDHGADRQVLLDRAADAVAAARAAGGDCWRVAAAGTAARRPAARRRRSGATRVG